MPGPSLDARQAFIQAWLPNPVEGDAPLQEIDGEIPRELHGTLYRNGPCQKILPQAGATALHLFDGDALVHALRFEDGGARWRSRFARTASFEREQQEGVFCIGNIGVRPDRLLEDAPPGIQPNTNVVAHAGRLMALVENAPPFELDPETLDSKGHWDLDGRLLGMSVTAHPKIDGRTGQLWIHGYQPTPPFVQLYCIEPDGRVSQAEVLDAPHPSMMHDFAITENHVVLPLGSLFFDVGKLMQGAPFHEVVSERPDTPLRFGIRRREPGSPVRWFETSSQGYLFHPGNAYERDGKIFMDACTYERPQALMDSLSTIRRGEAVEGVAARPHQYVFDLEAGTCSETRFSDSLAEFPRIDDRLVGHENRVGYATTAEPAEGVEGLFRRITRYDRQGGPSVHRAARPGQFLGEPVFVPRSPDAEEDDGFVLFQGYDGASDRSFFEILDARGVDAEPLARLWMPARIPLGFHGNWLPRPA